MRWASALSEEPIVEVAAECARRELQSELGDIEPDLVLVFVSEHHAADYEEVLGMLRRAVPSAVLIGCSGGGVVGAGREVEHAPALSLTAAVLPGVDIRPFYMDSATVEAVSERPDTWGEVIEDSDREHDGDPTHFILLPDPFSCDPRSLLTSLDEAYPSGAKVGGLASGGQSPGGNALFIGDDLYREGAVGVALSGALHVDTIVAQGCRPVGGPLFVTKAFRNRILELDGRRPTDLLGELFSSLGRHDRRLVRTSLFLGVVMTEGLPEYSQGDFLVRNLVGVDSETGVIAVAEVVEAGQVVQFHVRDADASRQDLEALLRGYAGAEDRQPPRGALMFSCLGRGEYLYGEPDHDSRLIQAHLGKLPLGGFFCSGEIGPVNDRTFLHGYTSSIALFRSRSN